MQHSPHEITEKLLKALDKDYNVVDMPVVIEVIGILEKISITKDVLETTRLGRYVNELRRKTSNEAVAKRAKDLVRKWRDLILPQSGATTPAGAAGDTPRENGSRPGSRVVSPAIAAWNKTGQISPALGFRRSQPTSPAGDDRVSLSPSSQQYAGSPNLSPRSYSFTSKPQSIQLPHAEDGEAVVAPPRGRGRPPLDRSSREPLKSPPRARGRGRPPLDGSKPRGRPPSSPGAAPRGRGRPPKNKNKLKASSVSTPSNLVPKTSPANKRLRKSSGSGGEESPAILKVNGVYESKVPELTDVDAPDQVPSESVTIPKKRGRKKGSKNANKRLSLDGSAEEEDELKEKMALVRNRKVKTTKELLQQIQSESSLDNLRNRTLSSLGVEGETSRAPTPVDEVTATKTEHIHKFLRSQPQSFVPVNATRREPRRESRREPRPEPRPEPRVPATVVIDLRDEDEEIIDVEKMDSEESPVKVQRPETVEEILGRLPALNPEAISWSDSESCESYKASVTEEDVDRLQSEHLEGLNGNFNDGALVEGLNHGLVVPLCDRTDRALPNSIPNNETEGVNRVEDNFREWQETVSRRSFNGELLHILPYVIID